MTILAFLGVIALLSYGHFKIYRKGIKNQFERWTEDYGYRLCILSSGELVGDHIISELQKGAHEPYEDLKSWGRKNKRVIDGDSEYERLFELLMRGYDRLMSLEKAGPAPMTMPTYEVVKELQNQL